MGFIGMILWDATRSRKRTYRRKSTVTVEHRRTVTASPPPAVTEKPPRDVTRWIKPALLIVAAMLVVYLVGGAVLLAVRFWPVTIAVIVAATIALGVRQRRKDRRALAARADLQNRQYLDGDGRGLYGTSQ